MVTSVRPSLTSRRQSLGHIVRRVSMDNDMDEVDNKLAEKIDVIRLVKICGGLCFWLLGVYAIIIVVVETCFNTGDLNSEDSFSFEKLDDPYKVCY